MINSQRAEKSMEKIFSELEKLVGYSLPDDIKEQFIADEFIPEMSNLIFTYIGWIIYGPNFESVRNPFSHRKSYASYSKNKRHINGDITDFSKFYVDSPEDADIVISRLNELCYTYGEATIEDFLTAMGFESKHKDNRIFGWKNLKDLKIKVTGDKYYFSFPEVVKLI